LVITNSESKGAILFVWGDGYSKFELDRVKVINNIAADYSPLEIKKSIVTMNNSHF